MPKIPAERLGEIGRALFVAAGTPPEEAEIVMRHVVAANLAGHDSHGVIQIPTYIERIRVGHIVPGAPWKIVQESPTTTVVDGHWGFGYVVNERAMKLTIEKAKSANVAAATVFRQGHIGRVASYTLMAAREGMIGIATADSGRSPKAVAPFGGREARLGTNPISIAMPSDLNTPVPPGWIIDRDGKPTTDPSQLRQGGALLPVGGSEGYKGYGLSVMVEILCGLLTGLGFGVEPTGRHNDGCFMAVFNVEAFRPLAEFKKDIGEFAAYLKATKPAEGSGGVYYPGEIEHLREEDRRQNGVEVEDATWYKLRSLAEGYGLADQLGFTEVE
jgi:LDH2 family malate/lactate/ureidoglycolate dehydrogenase